MSYSLQLANGDLTVSSAQLGTVTDIAKLTQDLRCCLLEHMGNDDMHLDYGSLLDGGTTPDGHDVPGVIGLMDLNQVASTLQSEIARIASSYQAQQLARAKTDQVVYGRISLTPAEALVAVTDISIQQLTDTLIVVVTLQTGQGQTVLITLPMLASSA